jgi:hypothetical protein
MPDVIESGERLPRPEGCDEQMYGLLQQCWQYDSSDRPTFQSRSKSLSDVTDASADLATSLEVLIGNQDVVPESSLALAALEDIYNAARLKVEQNGDWFRRTGLNKRVGSAPDVRTHDCFSLFLTP